MVVYRQLDQGAEVTVIDTQVSANRFYEDQQRRGLHGYKPTDIGLPSYLDEYCQALNNCMLPTINIGGYQGVSTAADGGLRPTNLQGTATSPASSARTRSAAASTTAWRCARPA